MSEAMRTTETPNHTQTTSVSGNNILQSGISIGRSMTKHCVRYHLHSFNGYDSFTHSHTDGTEVKTSNANTSAHFSDSHTSNGLRQSSSSEYMNGKGFTTFVIRRILSVSSLIAQIVYDRLNLSHCVRVLNNLLDLIEQSDCFRCVPALPELARRRLAVSLVEKFNRSSIFNPCRIVQTL